MAIIENYQDKKSELTTFLDLYAINSQNGQKYLYSQLCNQEAYDVWHLSLYFKEIMYYKKQLREKKITLDQLQRKEKNLLLYLILTIFDSNINIIKNRTDNLTIVELGCSLFEMIDGLEVIRRFIEVNKLNMKKLDLMNYKYKGIDISEMLTYAAIVLHKNYKVEIYKSIEMIRQKFNILYDRCVSSYALTTSKELAKFINLSDVALMNLFLSKNETFCTNILKPITYFSIEELISHTKKPIFHLFGEKAPVKFPRKGKDVLEGFFISCTPKFLEEFMKISTEHYVIKRYFNEKNIIPNNIKNFIK